MSDIQYLHKWHLDLTAGTQSDIPIICFAQHFVICYHVDFIGHVFELNYFGVTPISWYCDFQ